MFKTQEEFLKTISNWQFKTNPLSELISDIKLIEEKHKSVEQLRSSLDYDIDGLVYKVNQLSLQKDLEILLTHLGGQ